MDSRYKIALLILLLPLMLSLISTTALGSELSTKDWPMLQGNPSRTGAGIGSPVLTATLLWKSNITTNVEYYSAPVIENGIVYASSSFAPGGYYTPKFHPEGNIVAFNALTGEEIWDYKENYTPFMGTPAVSNGMVFFGSSRGYLGALDAHDGSSIWNYSDGNSYSSPAIVDGTLYFGTMDGWNGNVHALDAKTGHEIWNYTTPVNYTRSNGVASSPAVVNGVVYIGSNAGGFYALSSKNGELLWNRTFSGGVSCTPVVANGLVYFTADKFYALNATNGNEVWNFAPTLGQVSLAIAAANGFIYVGSHRGYDYKAEHTVGSATLYCLDAATGAKVWSFDAGINDFDSSPTVVGGVIYSGSAGGNIYALNATTGSQLWLYQTSSTPSESSSSPAVVNGVLYVGAGDLFALGTPSPTPISTVPEFSWPAILPLFVSVLLIALAIKRYKTR